MAEQREIYARLMETDISVAGRRRPLRLRLPRPRGAVAVSGQRGFEGRDRRAARRRLHRRRAAQPYARRAYAYVTTPAFLSHFGFESLRDLPDIETLEDAGLLGRSGGTSRGADVLASELKRVFELSDDEDEPEEDAAMGNTNNPCPQLSRSIPH